MSNRPKCAFTDCDNPVMKGETTGRLLSVCRECYERNRMFEQEPPQEPTYSASEPVSCDACGSKNTTTGVAMPKRKGNAYLGGTVITRCDDCGHVSSQKWPDPMAGEAGREPV